MTSQGGPMATPAERGFTMPPEWAPHERCWMAWPCRQELFGNRLQGARKAYAEVARAIARSEPVSMLARPDLIADASLASGKGVSVVPMGYDDSWIRDTGPTFVQAADGTVAGIDWRFNGYGHRQPAFEEDAKLAGLICERLQIERIEAPFVLEGGAIHVDGEGTALACAESILDERRNLGLDRARLERLMADYLGVETVIWLERGFEDDLTGGHVDNLACFAGPGRVVAMITKDQNDPNHERLATNLAILKAARDARGREFEVIEIPQPKARRREDGRRLTTSYINFYLSNGAVVLPMFEDAADDTAHDQLERAFPEREVIQIEALDLVHGGGGIHCITQPQPARPAAEDGQAPAST